MARNLYTDDEVVLCTYAALYDADDFGGCDTITTLTGRKANSIPAKIRNIVATLDKYGIPRRMSWSAFTGTTTGRPARNTNWGIIEPLTYLSRESLLDRCLTILG
jgi:hypothetical protein